MSEEDREKSAAIRGDSPPNDISQTAPGDLGPFLEEFRPYLLAIAMAELPDALRGKVGASDLVQETIVKGLKNFATFQGSTRQEFAVWLRTILFNVLANCQEAYHAAKRDVAREVSLDGSGITGTEQASPSATALAHEQWVLLEHALSRLPEAYREIVILRHREGLTFGEIGNQLQKSEDAVRKTWLAAIRQLQQELSEHESSAP